MRMGVVGFLPQETAFQRGERGALALLRWVKASGRGRIR